MQVKTTMNNPNCDEESDVEENYDDNKTLVKDNEKKINNESKNSKTSSEFYVYFMMNEIFQSMRKVTVLI